LPIASLSYRAQGTRAAGCFQCAIGRRKGHKNANFGIKKKTRRCVFTPLWRRLAQMDSASQGLATHSRWGFSALDRKVETHPSRANRAYHGHSTTDLTTPGPAALFRLPFFPLPPRQAPGPVRAALGIGGGWGGEAAPAGRRGSRQLQTGFPPNAVAFIVTGGSPAKESGRA
jgi:hypothetical protein